MVSDIGEDKRSYDQILIEPLERANTSSNQHRFGQYPAWFFLGCLWGIVSQLAMIGFTVLVMKYEVGLNVWLGRFIVTVFSIINIGVPFFIWSLLYQIPIIAVMKDETYYLNNGLDAFDQLSRMFVIFFLLGSMLGMDIVCIALTAIFGQTNLSVNTFFGALLCITFLSAAKLFNLLSLWYSEDIESESDDDFNNTNEQVLFVSNHSV